MPKVLVLGGGIAGLSTAMELIDDHDVTVVERRNIAGGKARTWTDAEFDVFREHSFRVFHESYHNTWDTTSRVPAGEGRSVRDNFVRFVSRADLDATGENLFRRWLGAAVGSDPDAATIPNAEKAAMFGDLWRVLKALCSSDARLRDKYAHATFADLFATRPDGTKGLAYQALKDMSQVEYSADRVQPDVKIMLNFIEKHFMHGRPGIAWNALNAPTSQAFIEPWREHLAGRGVEFRLESMVTGFDLELASNTVAGVSVSDTRSGQTQTLEADYYVSALPSNDLLDIATKELLIAAPSIARLGEVRRVWNNGVMVYTSKKTRFLGGFYMWHPWRVAVTTYADRWGDRVDIEGYGVGDVRGKIRDVISYVITDWHESGIRVPKKASECTPDEIYDELCYMSLEDPTLMPEFDPADHVRPVDREGNSVSCLVDASLVYDPEGKRIVVNEDTLMHLPPGGSFRMPGAQTEIANLMLASTHCFNSFACGDNMESANETGRRAANAILAAEGSRRRVPILEGRTASRPVKVLQALRKLDAAVYRPKPTNTFEAPSVSSITTGHDNEAGPERRSS